MATLIARPNSDLVVFYLDRNEDWRLKHHSDDPNANNWATHFRATSLGDRRLLCSVPLKRFGVGSLDNAFGFKV